MMRSPMKVWAVTGPAGAGKSAVSGILARAGAAIVDGDQLGHELLGREDIQARIAQELGPQYVRDGVVDRAGLGSRVFGEPEALQRLNEIMHGPLAQLAAEKLEKLAIEGKHELAVFEAAVYFLLPSPPEVDLVVAVVAAPEVRAQRLVDRSRGRSGGRMSATEARRRIEAQANMSGAWARADEIITNDGTIAELEVRTMRLLTRD